MDVRSRMILFFWGGERGKKLETLSSSTTKTRDNTNQVNSRQEAQQQNDTTNQQTDKHKATPCATQIKPRKTLEPKPRPHPTRRPCSVPCSLAVVCGGCSGCCCLFITGGSTTLGSGGPSPPHLHASVVN